MDECITVTFMCAGDESKLKIKKDGLLRDLKNEYEKQEGIEPEDQSWFYGFFPLESDDFPLSSDLPLSIVVPQAAEPLANETEREITIVFGPSSSNFETLVLTPGWSQNLTLTKGKLGIVTRTTRDQHGKDVFTADRYKIPEGEFPVVLKAEGNNTVVYTVVDGQEELLPVEKSVKYKANTRLQRAVDASTVFANVSRGLNAVARFIERVVEFIPDIE
jgi:hypothetical protein